MKTFKFYLAALAIALSAGFTSCSNEYDDSEIWDKVNDLLNRVQKLEASVQQQNANITALQTMLDAIKDNVYVTSVEELADGKGYALKFSNGKEVEIYHGEKGEPGESPSITIINEGDNYYWSVNGEVLKDNDGNKIPADGGAADVLPLLKTGSQLEADGVAGNWEKDAVYVTTDNVIWKKVNLGDSTGTSIFTSVEISEDGTTIIITLSDGSTITMPKYSKIQEMLYGGWITGTEINTERQILVFNENGSYNDIGTYTYDGKMRSSIDCGVLKFMPDNYILTSTLDYNNEYSSVSKIVEISDKHLVFSGDFAEGKYTRLTASELDNYYTLAFVNDENETWGDGSNKCLLNEDGTGKFNSEKINWKVENSKLVITKSSGDILLSHTFRFLDDKNMALYDENGASIRWMVESSDYFTSGANDAAGEWTCTVYGDNSEVVETYSISIDYFGKASIEKDGVVVHTLYTYYIKDYYYPAFYLAFQTIDQIDGASLSGRLWEVNYVSNTSAGLSGTLYYWNFDAYGQQITKKYKVVLTR